MAEVKRRAGARAGGDRVRPGPDGPGREGTPFRSTLFRWSGPGGWVFAPVPVAHAPGAAGPFGRVPVVATVDGRTWSTSVWRGRQGDWLLAVPARIRAGKDDGDSVEVVIEVDHGRL
ncbi:DUF1905 domain-containing protein [Micromonospora costi]|uniref:DUF1905 domain-containing protein n=1 Tax=Micromonospora costi TaxID=1530042 RepID=UPI0033D23B0E